MVKTKVLFDISGSDAWIGGIYYMRNIIYQLTVTETIMKKCELIVVYSDKYAELFDEFASSAKLIEYNSQNRYDRLKKLLYVVTKADLIYYYHGYKFDPMHLLRKKAIYWIPDFQECYYPEFFSEGQLEQRKKRVQEVVDSKHPLVLSSNSCKNDFLKFYDKQYSNIFIVPFVSAIDKEVEQARKLDISAILEKHDLKNKKYVMISNQFWQHKNHLTVFKAIAEAKEQGILQDIIFVFTGTMQDSRNNSYIDLLKKAIDESQINDKIRVLGFISRTEQLAMMMQAQLVIQPSLFEGWGTVVEDCKVLDKTIVLSDLPVHREQKNDKCYLFAPTDPKSLLTVLEKALSELKTDDPNIGLSNMKHSAIEYAKGFDALMNKYMEEK